MFVCYCSSKNSHTLLDDYSTIDDLNEGNYYGGFCLMPTYSNK